MPRPSGGLQQPTDLREAAAQGLHLSDEAQRAQLADLALALGIVAFYLAVAVQVTSLIRQRMPAGWWRRVHHVSVPPVVGATANLLLAGTDADHPMVLLTVGGLSATIVLLLWFWLPVPLGTTEVARRD